MIFQCIMALDGIGSFQKLAYVEIIIEIPPLVNQLKRYTLVSRLCLYKQESGNFSLAANLKHFRLPSANSYPIKLMGNHLFSRELRSVLNWRMTAGRDNFIRVLKNRTRVYTTENALNDLPSFLLLRQTSLVSFLSIVRFKDIFPSESDTTGRKMRCEAIYQSTLNRYEIIYSGTTPVTIPNEDSTDLQNFNFRPYDHNFFLHSNLKVIENSLSKPNSLETSKERRLNEVQFQSF
uniref:Uncharacterized protein n=1 Tax=Glossina pallidipes TaxID=7398 RepID=A0A1A9Z6V3_GLOPL